MLGLSFSEDSFDNNVLFINVNFKVLVLLSKSFLIVCLSIAEHQGA